jgi:hypothetical protein
MNLKDLEEMEKFDKESRLESVIEHLAEAIGQMEDENDQESMTRLAEILTSQANRLIGRTYER